MKDAILCRITTSKRSNLSSLGIEPFQMADMCVSVTYLAMKASTVFFSASHSLAMDASSP